MILRNLKRRPAHSLVSVLVIITGVVTVLLVNSFVQIITLNYPLILRDPSSRDLIVTQSSVPDVIHSNLDLDLGQRMASVAGVERVEPGVFYRLRAGNVGFLPLYGYEPGSSAMSHFRVVEGRPVGGPGQIIMGRRAADSLRKTIDSSIKMFGKPYQIVGIYETGNSVEELGAVMTLAEAQGNTRRERSASLFRVVLRADADARQAAQSLGALGTDLSVRAASEWTANEQFSSSMVALVWGLAAVMILIGGLWLMIGLTKGVFLRAEQAGEAGRPAWTTVFGEAAVLAALGGLLGLVVGALLLKVAGQKMGLGLFLGSIYSAKLFLPGLLTALGIGLLGGLYPAWKGARLSAATPAREFEEVGLDPAGARSVKDGRGLSSLWQSPARTLLALLFVGICFCIPFSFWSVNAGLSQQINRVASNGSAGELVVSQRDAPGLSVNMLDQKLASQIQAIPQVESVSPVTVEATQLEGGQRFLTFGLDPADPAVKHYRVLSGNPLAQPGELLIGSRAAEKYKLAPGANVTLDGTPLRVAGVFETGVSWEDNGGLVSLADGQRLWKRPNTVSFIFVNPKSPADAASVAQEIEQRFPETRARRRSEFAGDNVDIRELSSNAARLQLLALIIAALVVANVLTISVLERRRVAGAAQARGGWLSAFGRVLREGLALSLLAGVVGLILSLLLLWLATRQPGLGAFLATKWDVGIVLQAVSLCIFAGLLGGVYPALLAARRRPAPSPEPVVTA